VKGSPNRCASCQGGLHPGSQIDLTGGSQRDYRFRGDWTDDVVGQTWLQGVTTSEAGAILTFANASTPRLYLTAGMAQCSRCVTQPRR
jgi:hypothetical protein